MKGGRQRVQSEAAHDYESACYTFLFYQIYSLVVSDFCFSTPWWFTAWLLYRQLPVVVKTMLSLQLYFDSKAELVFWRNAASSWAELCDVSHRRRGQGTMGCQSMLYSSDEKQHGCSEFCTQDVFASHLEKADCQSSSKIFQSYQERRDFKLK